MSNRSNRSNSVASGSQSASSTRSQNHSGIPARNTRSSARPIEGCPLAFPDERTMTTFRELENWRAQKYHEYFESIKLQIFEKIDELNIKFQEAFKELKEKFDADIKTHVKERFDVDKQEVREQVLPVSVARLFEEGARILNE